MKKERIGMEKTKRKEQYLYSKGQHKASVVELIIVQLLPKLVDIGHTKTP